MRHRWDSQITKKKRFKTCINCGTVFETGWPSVYYVPYSKHPFFLAPDCSNVQYKVQILKKSE